MLRRAPVIGGFAACGGVLGPLLVVDRRLARALRLERGLDCRDGLGGRPTDVRDLLCNLWPILFKQRVDDQRVRVLVRARTCLLYTSPSPRDRG